MIKLTKIDKYLFHKFGYTTKNMLFYSFDVSNGLLEYLILKYNVDMKEIAMVKEMIKDDMSELALEMNNIVNKKVDWLGNNDQKIN